MFVDGIVLTLGEISDSVTSDDLNGAIITPVEGSSVEKKQVIQL